MIVVLVSWPDVRNGGKRTIEPRATFRERENLTVSVSARLGRLRSRSCRWAGRHSFEPVSRSALILPLPPPLIPDDMVASPRMSDHELAAINAAAVTREYNVKPHLGEHLRHAARSGDSY